MILPRTGANSAYVRIIVMTLFAWPKSTRGQIAVAAAHVALLVVPLWVAWEDRGPPPDKAFWLIFIYFVEIAICGVLEMIIRLVARSRG